MAAVMTAQCHRDIRAVLMKHWSRVGTYTYTIYGGLFAWKTVTGENQENSPFLDPSLISLLHTYIPLASLLLFVTLIDVFAPRSNKRLINSRGDQMRSQQVDGSRNHLLGLAHSAKPQVHIILTIAWWKDELFVPCHGSTARVREEWRNFGAAKFNLLHSHLPKPSLKVIPQWVHIMTSINQLYSHLIKTVLHFNWSFQDYCKLYMNYCCLDFTLALAKRHICLYGIL